MRTSPYAWDPLDLASHRRLAPRRLRRRCRYHTTAQENGRGGSGRRTGFADPRMQPGTDGAVAGGGNSPFARCSAMQSTKALYSAKRAMVASLGSLPRHARVLLGSAIFLRSALGSYRATTANRSSIPGMYSSHFSTATSAADLTTGATRRPRSPPRSRHLAASG